MHFCAHQLNEIRNGTDAGLLLAAFKYDANGNLTKKCDATSGGAVTQTTTDCTASGTGSSTLALAYDALDQLVQANKTGSPNLTFAYDDQGRRIRKTGATTTYYVYNGSDIHAEYASPAGNPTAVYAHGPSTDDPIARLTGTTNTPDATAAYYHADGLGSAVATTSAAGAINASQRFDAWGNRISGSGTVPQYGYTGREPDESGLVYYRARYYDPQVGRFTQRDPLGMVDGVNTYGYAAGNPVLFVDPEGTRILFAAANTARSYFGQISDAVSNAYSNVTNTAREFAIGAFDSFAAGAVNTPIKPEFGIYESAADTYGPYRSPFPPAQTNEAQFARDLGPAAGILLGLATRNPGAALRGEAQSIANGPRLARQLTEESARSPFTTSGTLTKDALASSRPVPNLGPGQLNNPSIPSGFGKYTTETFQSPAGNFQVHFYLNPTTNDVFYGLDYKTIFNSMSGVGR